MVVIAYAYTGVLTSIMAVPQLEPIIQNLDELAKSNRFRVTKERGLLMTNQFLVSLFLFINLEANLFMVYTDDYMTRNALIDGYFRNIQSSRRSIAPRSDLDS